MYSCEHGEVSSLRLAALRRRAARFTGSTRESDLGCRPPTSAFDIYCTCAEQRRGSVALTNAGASHPPVAAADLVFARWRYWLLMFYRQFFQELENSTWVNYHYYHRRRQQQQKQQTQLFISRQRRPVLGRHDGVSMRSARHYLCHSCTYSTDRKNNLKRHVNTMHRRPDDAVVTSAGRNHDDAETRGNSAAQYTRHVINHVRHTCTRCGYTCTRCGFTTDHKSNLLRHLCTFHNNYVLH